MTELIKITEHKGQNAISARDLHNFLGSKKDFSNWIKDRIESYGFVENQDFVCSPILLSKGRGGSNKIEYILSMDMAKELSMVERSERGKQARQYFIEMEKQAREPKAHIMTIDFEEPELIPYKTQVAELEKELRGLISENLYHGDLLKIAKKLKVHHQSVRNVIAGHGTSERIFTALYEKAVFNKEQKVRDLKRMINSLI